MRVRQQSSSGDMTFGNSQLNFLVNSSACVAQVVKTSLQLWLGEWSFDTSQGMPWLEGVLGKESQATSDLTIQNYVQQIQGVQAITDYASTQNTQGRTFVSELSIQTQYSDTSVQVLPEPPLPPSGFILSESGDVITSETGDPIITESP